jgi:hypothetical protein
MRIAVVLALGAALAVAATAYGRGAVSGVLHGFHPETAASAGTRDIWILGWYRCKVTKSCQALVRSTDGGRQFTRVATPPLSTVNTPTLEFTSSRVGYASEAGSRVYVTHDGGNTWHPWSQAGVADVAVASGRVYAIFKQNRFEWSSASAHSWHTVKLPVKLRFLVSEAVRGRKVWLLGSTRNVRAGDFTLRSTSRGATFKKSPGPCIPELGGRLVPAGLGVVWALCPTGMMAGLGLSTNGGRTFPTVRSFRDPGGIRFPALTNGAELFPISVSAAVLFRGASGPLFRTTDMGRRWARVRGTVRFEQLFRLRFVTSRVGAALFTTRSHPNQASLWRTTDGGATWHSMPIR